MKPLVDPNCLCGRPWPCQQHAPFAGRPYRVPPEPPAPIQALEQLLYILRRDISPSLNQPGPQR